MTSYELRCGQSDTGAGFSSSFFGVPLLIIILQLFPTYCRSVRYTLALTRHHIITSSVLKLGLHLWARKYLSWNQFMCNIHNKWTQTWMKYSKYHRKISGNTPLPLLFVNRMCVCLCFIWASPRRETKIYANVILKMGIIVDWVTGSSYEDSVTSS